MRRVIRVLLALIGLGIGCILVSLVMHNVRFPGYEYVMFYTTDTGWLMAAYVVGGFIFGLLGYALSNSVIDGVAGLYRRVEQFFAAIPAVGILLGAAGMALGFLLAYLIGRLFYMTGIPAVSVGITAVLYCVLGIAGARFGMRRCGELLGGMHRDGGARPKVLDTSTIIDGRILDISRTDFLDGELVIPEAVLGELRHISDSSDPVKRTRGRRGLDVIKTIQEEKHCSVRIDGTDFPDVQEVDEKILCLTEKLKGVLVTNDYNLNKVASVRKLTVLNINELANAMRVVVLPGEEISVTIQKEGKEAGQGVGYLDDGTMVIVDGAKRLMGQTASIEVTSALQTAAGRMVFAKLKQR